MGEEILTFGDIEIGGKNTSIKVLFFKSTKI